MKEQKLEHTTLPIFRIEKHWDLSSCREDTIKTMGALKESILRDGLLYPIVVWEVKCAEEVLMEWGTVDIRFFIIDGFRRWDALQELLTEKALHMASQIPVVIIKNKSLQEVLGLQAHLNLTQEPMSLIEEQATAHQVKQSVVYENEGIANKHVANLLIISQVRLHLLNKLRSENASPLLGRAIQDGLISERVAFELLKKDKKDQADVVVMIQKAILPKEDPIDLIAAVQSLVNEKKNHDPEEPSVEEKVANLRIAMEQSSGTTTSPLNYSDEIEGIKQRQEKIISILEMLL